MSALKMHAKMEFSFYPSSPTHLKGNGRTNDLLQVTPDNGDFRHDP